MRLKIRFNSENNKLVLPLEYHQILQGFIYHSLANDQEFSEFLHEYGFHYENRVFKLFTFSRLFGKYYLNLERREIIFESPMTWYVSSILPKFIQLLGHKLLLDDQLRLHKTNIFVDQLEYEKEIPIQSNNILIEMISPVTIYSTYQSYGKKITQFFSPYDPVFSHLIEENAKKKYESFYNYPIVGSLEIIPIRVTKKHKVVTKYKNSIINGWNGVYELKGPIELLKLLYCTGIGGKNSQGFGMFQIFNRDILPKRDQTGKEGSQEA